VQVSATTRGNPKLSKGIKPNKPGQLGLDPVAFLDQKPPLLCCGNTIALRSHSRTNKSTPALPTLPTQHARHPSQPRPARAPNTGRNAGTGHTCTSVSWFLLTSSTLKLQQLSNPERSLSRLPHSFKVCNPSSQLLSPCKVHLEGPLLPLLLLLLMLVACARCLLCVVPELLQTMLVSWLLVRDRVCSALCGWQGVLALLLLLLLEGVGRMLSSLLLSSNKQVSCGWQLRSGHPCSWLSYAASSTQTVQKPSREASCIRAQPPSPACRMHALHTLVQRLGTT
jgi:hypothetical protein